MDRQDSRKHSPKVQEALRKQVVKLRKRGMTYPQISKIVGMNASHCCVVYKRYEAHGARSIHVKRRGRPPGSCRTLTVAQEAELQRLIVDKTPDQLKLAFALWTRRAVQLLIRKRYEIEMPIRTVGEYLKRWGYTPQKPVKRAYEQSPKAVQRWLDEEYPQIAECAKSEGAEIYWGDETGLRNDAQHGRGYAPRGNTPVVHLNANRTRLNMISAITNQGKVRFMIYRDTMNADRLIEFMKRLIKDAGRKVFLILDNLRVHHSKPVKKWLGDHDEQIEVFYLPSYSPELNPDEYLNGDLKAGVHSKAPARTVQQLQRKTRSHMRMLQNRPARVRKYFQHHCIQYAA